MEQKKSLLRLVTAGSVDDGKSTLIGRLLWETGSVPEDQYEAVRRFSLKRGLDEPDLALLLDGLAVEREQLITIDVAYRYFSTPTRKFVIADCPGHEQYTRNMVTGASTADLAILLVDAGRGIVTQSRRHAFLVSLMQIPHVIVVVNKMDEVAYSEAVFRGISAEFAEFCEKLAFSDLIFVPVSALRGDNVVARSQNMPWYDGQTLMHHLEHVHVSGARNLIDFRFPVQCVIRPDSKFRGFAGRIVSGTLRTGETVAVLPSGMKSEVEAIVTHDGELGEAFAGQSVVIRLKDDLDVSRGDMIVRANNLPVTGSEFEAIVCWMYEEPLKIHEPYLLKHTTRTVSARVSRVNYRIDVDTLHRGAADTLHKNEMGRVRIHCSLPLFYDPYRLNRGTGSFIIIDPLRNDTVAGGMIRGPVQTLERASRATLTPASGRTASEDSGRRLSQIGLEEREERKGHRAAVVWLTGYPGSGKTTIGRMLEAALFRRGVDAVFLDGDAVRQGLCVDLGFSETDRDENIRRVGEVARLLFENGAIVICSFISPAARQRGFVRSLIPQGRFLEIYVCCDVEVCRRRDPKELYRKAAAGELTDFTGVSAPYEEPVHPELVVDSEHESPQRIVETILGRLKAAGLVSFEDA